MKKLNIQRLEVKDGKDYAEVIFFSDLHYGSPFCSFERARSMLDYCLDNGVYVFFGGDMVEAATKYSVGAGVYEQMIDPNKQIEGIITLLGDLAHKNLILGYLGGNHEFRVMKETGIDISKIICRELKIPYLGAAGWNLWYVGNQSYTIYAIHGLSGAKFPQTKLKSATDIANTFQADVLVHSHVHDIITHSLEKQYVDRGTKSIITKKCHIVITGHYLDYYGS